MIRRLKIGSKFFNLYISTYIPTKTLNVPTYYKYYPLGSGYKEEDWGMANEVDPGQECGLLLTIWAILAMSKC